MSQLLDILRGEKNSIPYRPEIAKEIWVISSIILQQMIYRWWQWEFYKFTWPCKHELYKEWDSWCEELWLSKFEFTNWLKKIAFKLWKTENTIIKEKALIIYYRNSNWLTFFKLQEDKINDLLNKCYNSTSLVNKESWFTKENNNIDLLSYTKNTSENTTEENINNKINKKDLIIKLEYFPDTEINEKFIIFLKNRNEIYKKKLDTKASVTWLINKLNEFWTCKEHKILLIDNAINGWWKSFYQCDYNITWWYEEYKKIWYDVFYEKYGADKAKEMNLKEIWF